MAVAIENNFLANQPVDNPPQKPLAVNLGAVILMSLAFPMSLMFWIMATAFYHPLRIYETFLEALIATSVIWIPASSQSLGVVPVRHQDKTHRIAVRSIHVIWWIFVSVACVYTINAKFDSSIEETHTMTVTGRDLQHNKHSISYFANVPSFTKPWPHLGFRFSIDELERVRVGKKDFDLIRPGVTQAVFVIKKGYLGFPWIVNSKLVPVEVEPTPALDPDYRDGLNSLRGENVKQDDTRAFELFKKAAERGDRQAQHDLAYMYSTGRGVAKSDQEAVIWLKKSAEQGLASAQDDLGVAFADGRGVDQNWIESYRWIARSARQGNPQAIKDLEYVKQNLSRQQMTEVDNTEHR